MPGLAVLWIILAASQRNLAVIDYCNLHFPFALTHAGKLSHHLLIKLKNIMIRHCVFIRFKPETSRERIAELFSEIDGLKHHLKGVVAVHVGANVSPETGMDKDYSDGFMVDFENAQSRDSYLEDPVHQAVGAKLVEAAVNGLEGILVYDLKIPH